MIPENLKEELNTFFKENKIRDAYHMKKRYFDADYLEVDVGWIPLVKEVLGKLKEMGWKGEIEQIKEKFGGLRLYLTDLTQEMDELVDSYERKSRTVCEYCGKPGQTYTNLGWWRTLDPECYAKEAEKQPKRKRTKS
jgi:hypothetical protein